MDGFHVEIPFREGSGFVKGNFFYHGKTLQGISLADEETMPGRIPDGSHDGGRGGENESTRTKYNQNRNGPDDFSGKKPGKSRSQKGNHDNPGRKAVC